MAFYLFNKQHKSSRSGSPLQDQRRRKYCTPAIFLLAYANTYAIIQLGEFMRTERQVSLFKNGRNQALRIPREFELAGNKAIVRKEGECLIIEPVQRRSLLAMLDTWEQLEEDLPEIADLTAEPVDI